MPALETDTLHLPHPRAGLDRFLFGHLAPAMTAFLPLTKVGFRNRDTFPPIHSRDPKVICRQKTTSRHEAIEIVLGELPNLLAIA
jgi:hypothetical protein